MSGGGLEVAEDADEADHEAELVDVGEDDGEAAVRAEEVHKGDPRRAAHGKGHRVYQVPMPM